MIGTRLGPYEITAQIGEGGMGLVYKAKDFQLGREVALKVLPEGFTQDAERLARFEREAKLLASLNHPNIAQIYGLETSGGSPALVMELVEGPTLADRLAQGSLSIDESLSIARQIAEALEEAHEKGIVHRDLKPQNVKASMEGKVKVLDFGLAKAMEPADAASSSGSPSGGAVNLTFSPTLTSPALSPGATVQGVILGTAAYMAPEQAKGAAVDKRADIWAFGVVLWEMLTGRRLFSGDSVAETLAGVLKNEIDLSALPEAVPPAIRRLLRRCLERNPRNRLHDIADARLEIDAALAAGEESSAPPVVVRARPAWLWPVAILLAAGSAGAGYWLARGSGTALRSLSVSVSPLTQGPGLEVQPTISPDGKWIAYASDSAGNWDIYLVRSTGGTEIDLTASSPADDFQPAFSPDGESIAFRSERDGGGIFVMGATGESARRVTDFGYNPSWSPDGRKIAFSSESITENPNSRNTEAALWSVDVGTGATTRLIDALDAVQPAWSPHGERIAFWGLPKGTGQRDLWTVAADGSLPVRVTADPDLDWSPAWSPDGRFLYFSSDRGGSLNLWRVAIDEKSGKVLSVPEAVTVPSRWCGQEALAADGETIVYTSLDRRANAERVALDPERIEVVGAPEPVTRGTVVYDYVDPSPDGSQLALTTTGRREDVYLLQLADHELRRLTDDPAKDRGVVWSPDGGFLTTYSDRSGKYEVWRIRPDGSGLERLTRTQGYTDYPVWSPDGSRLATTNVQQPVLFEMKGPFPATPSENLPPLSDDEHFLPSSWSPDGHRIAGVASVNATGGNASGVVLYSIATKSYRRVGKVTPPSGEYNAPPVWLPDGRHLVMGSGDDLMVVDSETGAARTLVAAPAGSQLFMPRPTRDGHALYYLRLEQESDLWMAKLGAKK